MENIRTWEKLTESMEQVEQDVWALLNYVDWESERRDYLEQDDNGRQEHILNRMLRLRDFFELPEFPDPE